MLHINKIDEEYVNYIESIDKNKFKQMMLDDSEFKIWETLENLSLIHIWTNYSVLNSILDGIASGTSRGIGIRLIKDNDYYYTCLLYTSRCV